MQAKTRRGLIRLVPPVGSFRPPPEHRYGDRDGVLLDCLGDLSDTHAVVLGDHALELLCALIRRGCAAATAIRAGEKMEADSASLIVVPQGVTLETIEPMLRQAKRALMPNGRIALRVDSDHSGWVSFSAARILRAHGFCAIRVRALADQTLLTAERPFFGPTLHS